MTHYYIYYISYTYVNILLVFQLSHHVKRTVPTRKIIQRNETKKFPIPIRSILFFLHHTPCVPFPFFLLSFFFFAILTSRVSGGPRTSINDENSRSHSRQLEDEWPAVRFDVPTSKSSFRRAVLFYSPLAIGRALKLNTSASVRAPPCLKKEKPGGAPWFLCERILFWRGSQSRGEKKIFFPPFRPHRP